MRFHELIKKSSSELYYALEKAAAVAGSYTKDDNGRTIYPEFDRVVIRGHSMRFTTEGKAAEFMKSPAAEKVITDAGWLISVMKDRQEQHGLHPDKTPRFREYTEVRLEDTERGETAYYSPEKLFHVTTEEQVASILEHGLEPREPTRPDMHQYKPRIHFALTRDGAEKIKRQFEKYDEARGVERQYAVLLVDTSAVDPIYVDPEYRRDGVYTDKPVPPGAITLF